MVLLFTGVRETRLRSAEYSFPSTREEDPVSPAQNAFPNLLPPAAPFLSAVKEMGERMPPKTNGFWISFWSISMRRKKVPQGISHGPALAAADVAGRESWRFCRSSDYQIAHLPPLAASAGAACWAAKYKKYALLRSVFCRTACQHAAAKPINQRTAARYAGAAAIRGVHAIRCTAISIYFGFRGVHGGVL